MKKLFYRLAVCLCVIGGLVGCSKDDEPSGGEGAMYQVHLSAVRRLPELYKVCGGGRKRHISD